MFCESATYPTNKKFFFFTEIRSVEFSCLSLCQTPDCRLCWVTSWENPLTKHTNIQRQTHTKHDNCLPHSTFNAGVVFHHPHPIPIASAIITLWTDNFKLVASILENPVFEQYCHDDGVYWQSYKVSVATMDCIDNTTKQITLGNPIAMNNRWYQLQSIWLPVKNPFQWTDQCCQVQSIG